MPIVKIIALWQRGHGTRKRATCFDPSYGLKFEGTDDVAEAERAWEDEAMFGWNYRYYPPNKGKSIHDNRMVLHVDGRAANAREVIFTP